MQGSPPPGQAELGGSLSTGHCSEVAGGEPLSETPAEAPDAPEAGKQRGHGGAPEAPAGEDSAEPASAFTAGGEGGRETGGEARQAHLRGGGGGRADSDEGLAEAKEAGARPLLHVAQVQGSASRAAGDARERAVDSSESKEATI